MRRLLPMFLAVSLLLAPSAPALAGNSRGTNRLPSAVTKINLAITFPLSTLSGRHKPLHLTLTRAATVAQVVAATNALPVARIRVMCPMIMRIGPVLSVIFRNAKGTEVAAATVDVIQGSKGDSGASPCFPIRFISSGKTSDLLGNSWVRLMGKLAGTAIS